MNRIIPTLALLFLTGVAWGNPFFAMDTAVRDLKELDTVKKLGYDGIGWKTGKPAEVAAALKEIQSHGLKLFAVYCYQPATLTKKGLTLDPHLEEIMKVLRGTETIIWLPIMSKDFAVSSPEGDAIAVPALQKLADLAAKHKLRIAIYPHVGCWTERIQDAVRVAKKVDRKNFGVTFNLCHCLAVGDEKKIPELLQEALPHLFMVTINGADANVGKPDWGRLIQPLDKGSFAVASVLKMLQDLNYTGPIGLQGFAVKIPVKDNLTRSINAWRKLNKDKKESRP